VSTAEGGPILIRDLKAGIQQGSVNIDRNEANRQLH
jgi:hypothetical protein